MLIVDDVLQSSLNQRHCGTSDKYQLGNSSADVPAYHFRSLTTAKRTCGDSRRPVTSVGSTYAGDMSAVSFS